MWLTRWACEMTSGTDAWITGADIEIWNGSGLICVHEKTKYFISVNTYGYK